MSVSKQVTVFDVGPRDGLQNEQMSLTFEQKKWFIEGLLASGLNEVEAGAFVRADKVPQMENTDQVAKEFPQLWYLVPNLKGLERAVSSGVKRVALFTAATETFNQKNIGMSIDESFRAMTDVVKEAKKKKIQLRGYVSTVFGCPFEGPTPPKQALKIIERMADFGVREVSIGDTIGVAHPKGVDQIIKPALKMLGAKRVAVHFHDTRGLALANTLRSLEHGVKIVDTSAGGLGGCPYAPGATGNLATEDLIYMLDGMGVKTGVNLEKLCETSFALFRLMNRPIVSRYLKTYASQK
ncbi:MAG: hydroxymethylglutaryl-CoA lyase [Xanthomonadaceae bacterium]|nr:hydroxymethylglutaryl-CoA lyase [Xanthomonadaceae bacterium]